MSDYDSVQNPLPKPSLFEGLVGALQFLTILPLGPPARFAPGPVFVFFPVAGLVIGALVSAFDYLAGFFLPAPVAAALDVALLAAVTGALHLDGLADTADGLLGSHRRERALEIMKDSRVGAMGLVAVAVVLIVKAAAIGTLSHQRILGLMLVPCMARCAMMVAIDRLPYARSSGTGQAFFEAPLGPWHFGAFLLPLALSLLLGWRALLLWGLWAAALAIAIPYYRRRMGGITGDMLGALNEVCEALLFVALAGGVP